MRSTALLQGCSRAWPSSLQRTLASLTGLHPAAGCSPQQERHQQREQEPQVQVQSQHQQQQQPAAHGWQRTARQVQLQHSHDPFAPHGLASLQHRPHQQQQLCVQHRTLSSSAAAASDGTFAGSDAGAGSAAAAAEAEAGARPTIAATATQSGLEPAEEQQLDQLMQVLLHPMPHTARWNAQLSPYLLGVNDQLLVQPSAVLLSVVRALHVMRAVLQEDGQVYVVETNRALRPIIKAAAQSCLNPNVWFYHRTWSPGMLTNYASTNRLFRESHQPNRKLFASKGYRPVNPLCPAPPPPQAPLPRLSWDDKWLLYRRTRRPGYRELLRDIMYLEDRMHRFKPAGSIRGAARDLSLVVFLDSTKNAVAIREAFNRNIPTIAVTNTAGDMSQVTYPVLARDFSPNFIHFFLDWIIKVANTAPGWQQQQQQQQQQ